MDKHLEIFRYKPTSTIESTCLFLVLIIVSDFHSQLHSDSSIFEAKFVEYVLQNFPGIFLVFFGSIFVLLPTVVGIFMLVVAVISLFRDTLFSTIKILGILKAHHTTLARRKIRKYLLENDMKIGLKGFQWDDKKRK
ncbi:hypothetical protein [Pseudoponticoccus marisrubri]|uniref:hypothetical protein n=1 Tax=Pseudoponticoccus marisrubri TaxID=1685382 RepID=UPI0014703780|nr:hypothetical protein [Pseudoponticoccus marisrubri]